MDSILYATGIEYGLIQNEGKLLYNMSPLLATSITESDKDGLQLGTLTVNSMQNLQLTPSAICSYLPPQESFFFPLPRRSRMFQEVLVKTL